MSIFEIEHWANELHRLSEEITFLIERGPEMPSFESAEVLAQLESQWVFQLQRDLLFWAFSLRRLIEEAREIGVLAQRQRDQFAGEGAIDRGMAFTPFEPQWREVRDLGDYSVNLKNCITWKLGDVKLGQSVSLSLHDLCNGIIHYTSLSFEHISGKGGVVFNSDRMICETKGKRIFLNTNDISDLTRLFGDLAFSR